MIRVNTNYKDMRISNLWVIIVCAVMLCVASCQKNNFKMSNPDTGRFIKMLKSGQYFDKIGYELPVFSLAHIPQLLTYLDDTSIISQFPTNPLSSAYTNPKILNECLLWTIDGIRLGNKYPSLEPCLLDTTTYSATTGYTRVQGKKLIEVAALYIKWYEEYTKTPTEQFKKINILAGTPYRWY